jgi:hypothetical protein
MLATLGTIFALLVLFLLEGPKMGRWLLDLMPPERAAYCRRVAGEISQSVTGYAFGNLLTSLIVGVVVFVSNHRNTHAIARANVTRGTIAFTFTRLPGELVISGRSPPYPLRKGHGKWARPQISAMRSRQSSSSTRSSTTRTFMS